MLTRKDLKISTEAGLDCEGGGGGWLVVGVVVGGMDVGVPIREGVSGPRREVVDWAEDMDDWFCVGVGTEEDIVALARGGADDCMLDCCCWSMLDVEPGEGKRVADVSG